MFPKMILTDLDKTLLCSDGNISEYTKNILVECQNRGILIVIATARYWIGAERYIEELKPDYEITTDGTLFATMSSDEFKKGQKISPLH